MQYLLRVTESGLNFVHQDGKRIDFIITWQIKPDDPSEEDAQSKRMIFQVSQS